MTGLSLYHMTEDYRTALAVLSESDIDEQTIADTLEGLKGELAIKAQNVAAFYLNLEAEAEAVKAAEKKMQERRKSLEKRVAQMKDYLLRNMVAAEIHEIKANDGSFRVRVMQGRESVVIEDEAKLPPDYLVAKYEPSKTLISQAIKDGYEVPGARIERKPSLRVE